MIRRGVDETVARKVSGHKTAKIFRLCDITSERDLADATKKIELGRQVAATEKTEPAHSGTAATSTKTDTLAF